MCGVIEGRKWIDERAFLVIYYQSKEEAHMKLYGLLRCIEVVSDGMVYYIYNTGVI